ncbi:MAG: glutamate--tRNA ligase family protein [Mucilaginibacter sp.]
MLHTPLQTFTKTRIAPTPSGFLHLGNAFSFALTADLAQKTNAKILLRIDDLDRQRANKLYVQDIFDTLNFLNIHWQEGPRNLQEYENNWSQVHRMPIYQTALDQLKQCGAVFACTCSRTQIEHCNCIEQNIPLETPNTAWRLRTDDKLQLSIQKLSEGIVNAKLPPEMKNFIVKKKDGYPAYQLASLMDDLHFGIDLVVRGEDLWPSTIAQHYLADILQQPDFQKITFHHHPLLMKKSEKLSKSAGDTSIKYLREQGKKARNIYEGIGRILNLQGDFRSFENFESLINYKE